MVELQDAIHLILTTVGSLFLLIVLVEFVPDWIKRFKRRDRTVSGVDYDYRNEADTFKNVDWGPRYFFEYWSALRNLEWHSYVYGRCRPFSGQFINVNQQGLRVTWNPDNKDSAEHPLRVFFFGGSTGWGMGARDDHTVPSELSRILEKTFSHPVEVTNFAENGYVATQSMLKLLLETRSGNLPDVVVFYDGINDTFSAFQSGKAGKPQNEYNRVEEFNVLHPNMTHLFYKAAVPIVFRRTLRLIDKIANFFVKDQQAHTTNGTEETGNELPKEVLSIYCEIMETVRSTGKRLGFESCFFWQPSIYTKKTLTEFEAKEKENKPEYADMLFKVNSLISEFQALCEKNGFFDIHHCIDDCDDGIYLDFAHVSEQGNRMIASIMEPPVRAALEESLRCRIDAAKNH